MKILVRLLGTGASFGIPGLGCSCVVCKSTNEKNKRLRASCFVTVGSKKILIDASPDLRQALLRYRIDCIDEVLITHFHADHTDGLNELRPLFFKNNSKPIRLYMSAETNDVVSKRFDYLMERFEPIILEKDRGELEDFRYFTYSHADVQVTGYRFGKFAYVTDIKEYNESIFDDLKDLDTLVLGAIHHIGTNKHFSIDEAIEFGKKVKARRVISTHISHEVEHETVNSSLPDGFELAYDGMEINV